MHRLVRSLLLLLVTAALGVSTGVAQPTPNGEAPASTSADVADQDGAAQSRVAPDRETRKLNTLTRAEIEHAILKGADRGTWTATQATGMAMDLHSSASGPLDGVQANGNRKVYYIVGGVLVAGGLVAGILALGDGGGGVDNGGGGIPNPPGRP